MDWELEKDTSRFEREPSLNPDWPEEYSDVAPSWEQAVRTHLLASPEISAGMVDRILAFLGRTIAQGQPPTDLADQTLALVAPGNRPQPATELPHQQVLLEQPDLPGRVGPTWQSGMPWQRVAALLLLGLIVPLGIVGLMRLKLTCSVSGATAYTLQALEQPVPASVWQPVAAAERVLFPRALRYGGPVSARPLASHWGRVVLSRWPDAQGRWVHLCKFPQALSNDSSQQRILTRLPRTPRALSGGINVAAWNSSNSGFVLVVPGTVEDYRGQLQLPEEGLAYRQPAVR